MLTGSFRGFTVSVEDPGIAVVTFNQPDRMNGMTMPMKRDLIEFLAQAQMDETLRVVVFTGTGRAFSAGDDIAAPMNDQNASDGRLPDIPMGFSTAKNHALGTYNGLRTFSQALNKAVRDLDKMTIAAINGAAIQSGMSLALACDFRIASTAARIGSGTLRFGLLPDEGGHYLLLQHLGLARTIEFLFRNTIANADEALALGLVNEVVSPGDLMPRAMSLAKELANGPQVAMRLLKRSLYRAAETDFNAALEDIASKTSVSDQHADAREGIAAFREKRKPVFNAWLKS
jgi:2-(1,2-epoxy-1,2-dihydrophenyl)acetyl-CoA isomerase